jgi:type IV pilus assembly protein PilY1
MRVPFLIKLILVGWLALVGVAIHAEDIDIYQGVGTGSPPNLLLILDNSAAADASSTFTCSALTVNDPGKNLGFEQCGLYSAISAITDSTALKDHINLGLMYFPTAGTDGGTFVLPSASPVPNSLLLMDTSGINQMLTRVSKLSLAKDKSNNNQIAQAMQEAWAFYQGKTGLSGVTYPGLTGQSCANNFVVYITLATNNQKPQDGGNLGLGKLKTAENLSSISQLALPSWKSPISGASASGKYQSDYSDEWAQFMHTGSSTGLTTAYPPITTYTIILSDGSNPDYEQLMVSMANNGGGKYFVVQLGDVSGLERALEKVFYEVQAVNSVFASASLPISAATQGTYLNQVFMGSFRPDSTGAPRWMGNLKQYQFGVDTSDPTNATLFLADANGASALSSAGTGFISPNAVSFWTSKDTTKAPDASAAVTNGTNGFWINHPQSAGGAFDVPDGEIVEKGGVSQQIRLANLIDVYDTVHAATPRNVYTCIGTNCTANSPLSSMPFATTNWDIKPNVLGTNGPALGISNIVRSGSTATVTLSSAPSPALVAGQSVTIAGSQYPEFNGAFSITPLTTTTFTYPITVDPPTPSTGTYTASIPSNPISVTLTRSSTTVTATSTVAHGYVTGQTVTISGATGSNYNGSYVVTNTGANTVTYTISEGPATPDGGGTAKVGSTSYAIPLGGIVRSVSNASNVSNVTVTLASTITFVVGNNVTISGAGTGGVSAYNGTWTITNISTACPGGTKSGNKALSFCFNINSTPTSPDASSTIKADGGTSPLTISSLAYTVGTCAAATYSTALVTATTATAPTFVAGDVVSVGGSSGANENAYVGNFTVVSVKTTTPYNFTYKINTSPGNASTCTDTTSGMTATTAGVSRDSLINWVRGADNIGDEQSPGNGITIRPSVHGDVLHSRPAVINYGGTTGIVVFYGSNDGMFRAVNGNQPPATNTSPAPKGSCTTSADCKISGVPPGGELWSFVPSEFYPKLQRLYNNSPVIQLSGTPTDFVPTPQPKDYFFDGTPGIYQDSANNKVYVYLSARRGGRLLYALDVTDPTNPKYLWKRTNLDTGFSELGQTWSQPKVARIKGNANPVLIFGAGYDPNEDSEPPATDGMGRGIFIVDAVDGTMLWQATPNSTCASGVTCVKVPGMTYAIPSDITLVDRNFDGYIDRLYAADVGGNIWRVDLEPVASQTALGKATVTQLAALGGTGTTKRKIFFPPDVVLTKQYDAVSTITGDREHPIASQQANGIVNRFYLIKDTNVAMSASGWTTVTDATDPTKDTPPSTSMLINVKTSVYTTSGSDHGFYFTLSNAGEKGINAPATVAGYVYFGTNAPTAPGGNSCSANLGTARSYAVSFITGSTSSVTLAGGGLIPSPVFGIVSISVNGTMKQLPFLIGSGTGMGADTQSGLGVTKSVIPVNSTRTRTYWYRKIDQ